MMMTALSQRKRYLIIGSFVYLLELIIIVIAQKLGASATLSIAISFWLGLSVSFGLQKVITFGDKRLHHKVLFRQIATYALLVLFNFGFTILVAKLLAPHITAVWSRTLALAITTIWNYYLYKTKLFTLPDEPIVY